MVASQDFDRDALCAMLGKAEIKPTIIEKISTPAERKLSWGEYRKIFITKERISGGHDILARESRDARAHSAGVRRLD